MITVGEKLNSSIPSVLSLFNSGDENAVREAATAQGAADYLDINTAMCDQELTMLRRIVSLALQSTTCGIMLDSPSPDVILGALDSCADRPVIINSVAEGERLEKLAPEVSSRGCGVIVMPVQASGCGTPSQRLSTAHRIVDRLVQCGVAPEKIFVDALAEAAAFDPGNATATLETLTLLKKELPQVGTALGVSNISFGLPARAVVNSAFLACAVCAGLDLAIIDVTSQRVTETLMASLILAGKDEYGIGYIEHIRARDDRRG